MKQIYLLVLAISISYTVNAQTTDVITTGLSEPTEILVVGDDLYVANKGHNKISKVDLSATTPTLTDVVTLGSDEPFNLALHGNDLYISLSNQGKISKVDLSATTPTPIDVFTGLTSPGAMAFKGNDMYFTGLSTGRLYKTDISAMTPTITEILSGLFLPGGLVFDGDELYISNDDNAFIPNFPKANEINKINVTHATPTLTNVVPAGAGLLGPNKMVLIGNDLYIINRILGKISKIDITDATPPTVTDVVGGIFTGGGLALHGNDLYISEFLGNKISKFNLGTLSVDDLSIDSNMFIYPNPSSDFIQVSNLNETLDYKIYNVLGLEVSKGTVYNNEKINITDLSKGVYFLSLDRKNVIKFIKH